MILDASIHTLHTLRAAFLLLVVSCLAGCATYGGKYHRTLPERIEPVEPMTSGGGHVEGEACTAYFWLGPIVIPISQKSDLRSAIENGLYNRYLSTDSLERGDAIINAYQYETIQVIPLPIGYYEHCTKVEGVAAVVSKESPKKEEARPDDTPAPGVQAPESGR